MVFSFSAPLIPLQRDYPDAAQVICDLLALVGRKPAAVQYQHNGGVAQVTMRISEPGTEDHECWFDLAIEDLQAAGGGAPEPRRSILEALIDQGVFGDGVLKWNCPHCNISLPHAKGIPLPRVGSQFVCPVCRSAIRPADRG